MKCNQLCFVMFPIFLLFIFVRDKYRSPFYIFQNERGMTGPEIKSRVAAR